MKPQDFATNEDEGVVVIEDRGADGRGTEADVVVIGGEGDSKLPKRAIEQRDGSVILPLRYSVTRKFKTASTGAVREESFHELHMHRLTGADKRLMDAAAPADRVIVAIARSTRMADAMFGALYDRMDASDIDEATNVILYFLGSGPTTGPSA